MQGLRPEDAGTDYIDVAKNPQTERQHGASSPGNRLEKLSGDRAGQYSIRINDQWRIWFAWKDDGPHDVEIADYH